MLHIRLFFSELIVKYLPAHCCCDPLKNKFGDIPRHMKKNSLVLVLPFEPTLVIFKFVFIFLYTLHFSYVYVQIDPFTFSKTFAGHSMVDQTDAKGPSRLCVTWLFLPCLSLALDKFNLKCASSPPKKSLFFLCSGYFQSAAPALGALFTPSLSDKVLPMFQGQSRSHVLLLEAHLPQLPSASIALFPVLPPSAICPSFATITIALFYRCLSPCLISSPGF